MKKMLKIIILRVFLEVFREPFLLLTPVLAVPTFIFLHATGIGHLLLILPVARLSSNHLNDTPQHWQEVRELEELLEKIKRE